MSYIQLVVFKLGEQDYGVDILQVKEIGNLGKVIKVPNSPSHIEGIMDLRHEIIPVVNLSKKLNLQEKDTKSNSKTLVAYNGKGNTAFIIDDAKEVLTVDTSCVEYNAEACINSYGSYIKGIVKLEARILLLIDLLKIAKDEAICLSS